MPILSTILGVAGLAASGVGIGESVSASGKQQDAIKSQLDIAKSEEARKQAIYQQLAPFFSEYMKSGSPFLANIQRAGAEQTATQANNAAGMVRGATERSGLGFGPSGTEAAALGGLGASTASTASSNYLTNLLNNEQIKFQAAQGMSGLANGPQISPQPAQYPINPVPGSVNSFGTALQNLLKTLGQGNGSAPGLNNLPIFSPGSTPTTPPIIPDFSGGGGTPTTQGFGFGPD